jgi:Family of unknown function (DUF6152)
MAESHSDGSIGMRHTIESETRVGGNGGIIRALIRIALFLSVGWYVPSYAHHSFAMFDQTRRVSVTGTVTEFQWTNPHAELFLMLESQDGKSSPAGEVWRLESDSPEVLRKDFQLRRDLVRVGDKITVVINPFREGVAGGHIVSWTLPDGIVRVRPTQ